MKKRAEHIIRKIRSLALEEAVLPTRPFGLLKVWVDDAFEAGLTEHNGMHLATIGENGRLASRVVLLKHIDEQGILFYTNYLSRKAGEMEFHPQVAASLWWPDLERQIRIEGCVKRAENDESDRYYHSRPEGSKVGAWASPQSEVIKDRAELEKKYNQYLYEFRSRPLTRPQFWGGYRLVPDYFEFWKGRENRLHDRIVFQLTENKWVIKRLAP